MFQKIKNIYHLFRTLIINFSMGFPSRKLKVIGVTGTDGKTTTTHLIYHALASSGKRVSMISTVYAKIAGKEYDTGFHVTTPDAAMVAKYLKMAVDSGDEYFVLETTSHRLDQNQLVGVNFKVGVITNITREHLDYHLTYENYVKAKMKLLKSSEIKIANRDDSSYEALSGIKGLKSYGIINDSDYKHVFPGDIAEFNKYNYLAAFAVCRELGLSEADFLKSLPTFILPKGRLETVYDGKFKVIIDFAHTPNALESLLPAVRKQYLASGGRLIHVFGSAGLRDQGKRPMMGEASGSFSDLVIVTEEDYRTEDAASICREISAGLEKKGFNIVAYDRLGKSSAKNYSVIINREKAVKVAISIARDGDVVVITGKAHEKSLCRGKTEYPYSEHEAVKKSLSLNQL